MKRALNDDSGLFVGGGRVCVYVCVGVDKRLDPILLMLMIIVTVYNLKPGVSKTKYGVTR